MQPDRGEGALRSALDAGLALPWGRLWAPIRRAAAWVMALPFPVVFGVLLLGQWLVVGAVAVIAMHNGWSYYSGGDDSWYYTSGWVLGHGHIPYAAIGYGSPVMLAPVAAIGGASLLAGLPLVVGLNMLVLWPAALGAVYGIAKAIGGRGYAYLATLAWVVFPLASIPYFYGRYHVKLIDQTLPQAQGLVATAEFASMVVLLVASYFALAAMTRRSPEAAVLAGLAVGFALALKPSNAIYLPAPLAAFAVARRPREILLLAAGIVPALVGLAVWKERGIGYIPAFSHSAVAVALGAGIPTASIRVHTYLDLDWSHLRDSMYGIREYTWSLRMVTWVLVAGAIALWRRSPAVAVLIGGWLASFILLKASAPAANVTDGSFFRLMTPSFPAFFFELVSLPLLVPIFGRRLAATGRASASSPRPWSIRPGTMWAAAALSIVPIAAFVFMHPLRAPDATRVPNIDQYVPANVFPLTATASQGGVVVLRWPGQDARGARAGYAVFRAPWDGLSCGDAGHVTSCSFYSDPKPSMLTLNPVAWTSSTSFRDRPGRGRWVYRVAAAVALNGPPHPGNYFELSRPATVRAGA